MNKVKTNKNKIHPLIRILLFINLLFILALILSYVAAYISPDKTWIFAMFGLSYPYLALANLIFVILWLILLRWYVFLSLVALLTGWNQIKVTVQLHKRQHVESASFHFRMLNYNLHNLSSLSGFNDMKNQDGIIGFLQDQACDVVHLQEFYSSASGSQKLLDDLRIKLRTPYYYSDEYFHVPNPKRTFALVTLSKYPITGKGTLRGSNEKAYCIYSDIVITGHDTVRFYNVHLESIHFRSEDYAFMSDITPATNGSKNVRERTRRILWKLKEAFQKRAIQARDLRRHIDQCPYPVVVCGDFNDVPTSYAYHHLAKNLQDVFVTGGKGFGFTYAGSLPFPSRIDHILIDRKFDAGDLKIPRVKFSDHYPEIAKIILK
ncbi:MAG: endonuclease/exonuclease/phosphatase family protein [Bacteroidetes bacterium]|nr:endonuclease/exonuclease/phosphatase family protein [Bacteroidota bacterium]